MARAIWLSGGSAADLDVVTAGAGNVEAGKVIVGTDGEPITGTVKNLSQDPDAQFQTGNGTPVIKGDAAFMQVNTDNVNRALIRYDGASERGKVIIQPNTLIGVPVAEMATAGGLTAAKLAQGQTAFGLTGTYKGLGNAAAADVRRGKTFSTASLSNATGTMTEQGGTTITPGTTAKTAVSANRYVTGNIVVAGDANLIAANIKKGVSIFGVTGTWEGWVPTNTDLYVRGNNINGITGGSHETSAIHMQYSSSGSLRCGSAIDLSPYSKFNVEMQVLSYVDYLYMLIDESSSAIESDCEAWVSINKTGTFTVSIDISNVHKSKQWYIKFARNFNLYVFRIWLS